MGKYRPVRQQGVRKKSRRRWRLLAALSVALMLLVTVDQQLRPVIVTMAQYQCQQISLRAINDAVSQELASDSAASEQLVRAEKGEDGSVQAIVMDADRVNALKTRLTAAVSQRLLSLPDQEISVPLGTLLGWQILAGRGPDIRLNVVPASYVYSELKDELTSAGINQTEHKLFIDFTVEMSAILPGYSTEVTVTDEVCISQTMIIGSVPQMYAARGGQV